MPSFPESFRGGLKGSVLVRVGGVGYLVHLSARARERLLASREGEQTTLPVALVVREETIELHGFGSKDERATFLLLLSVPGIGPKSAHNILAVADPRSLQRAVLEEDPSALTRVSGIGKKMAQKIILELKGKILTLSDEARRARRAAAKGGAQRSCCRFARFRLYHQRSA
ncbi:MAG: hypothetical protein KatS3mg100_008 [Candidatus Parcubacteria bacterium]|nr:MAG: hypothetical protein KatS3mg100_008 [Candidatus Parcubacteria bacterium]